MHIHDAASACHLAGAYGEIGVDLVLMLEVIVVSVFIVLVCLDPLLHSDARWIEAIAIAIATATA